MTCLFMFSGEWKGAQGPSWTQVGEEGQRPRMEGERPVCVCLFACVFVCMHMYVKGLETRKQARMRLYLRRVHDIKQGYGMGGKCI